MKISKKIVGIIALLIIALAIYWFAFAQASKTNYIPSRTKVVIIGATAGIGKDMAKEFVRRGYTVGITGRREHLLQQIKHELGGSNVHTRVMDISKPEEARKTLTELIQRMNGIDIIIVNAGTGNTRLEWDEQKKIIDVNVAGFLAVTSVATDHFLSKGSGHIVGISSIAALRGLATAPAYSASKAFISNYLDGLRARFKKHNVPIYVTDIQPGLIDTEMGKVEKDNSRWHVVESAKNVFNDFLRATSQEASAQICDVVEGCDEHAYATRRWRLVAWLFKFLPDSLFYQLI